MKRKLIAALGLALVVAGCGTNQSDRTTGGAAAGAATGATVGVLGGPVGVLAGAAIGAGAGAVTGATTTPQDVNLGPPPWSDDGRVVRRGPQSSAWIRHAQETLAARGFNPGPTDGVFGAQSVRATQDFQRANNLTVNGRLDAPTRAALNMSGAMPTQTRAASPSTR